ncbi:hypothetical protein AVEN_123966-1 [Araneus ventricosus]|uniref:Uncharacterized protein n=1 Tax=Araneus ventricosus TaxID=182803 RepID=A0A4Y2DBQ5_ARAVE|nr:hypothetical protein AVEN_123966-1 [Araneus ventricosus]
MRTSISALSVQYLSSFLTLLCDVKGNSSSNMKEFPPTYILLLPALCNTIPKIYAGYPFVPKHSFKTTKCSVFKKKAIHGCNFKKDTKNKKKKNLTVVPSSGAMTGHGQYVVVSCPPGPNTGPGP